MRKKTLLLKALLYRGLTIGITQSILWILFKRIDFNLIALLIEGLRTIWYFLYDFLWREKE